VLLDGELGSVFLEDLRFPDDFGWCFLGRVCVGETEELVEALFLADFDFGEVRGEVALARETSRELLLFTEEASVDSIFFFFFFFLFFFFFVGSLKSSSAASSCFAFFLTSGFVSIVDVIENSPFFNWEDSLATLFVK